MPYVRYGDPIAAMAWLSDVLGAREALRMTLPDGRVGHAELVVGQNLITIGLAASEQASHEPTPTRHSLRSMTLVFVSDVHAAASRATKLGGSLVDSPTDMPWGLRKAIVAGPKAIYGN